MTTHTVEIGSGSLRGSFLCGARQDHYYYVPEGTISVALHAEDRGCVSINIGSGNGKASLGWTRGDKTALVTTPGLMEPFGVLMKLAGGYLLPATIRSTPGFMDPFGVLMKLAGRHFLPAAIRS